MLAKVRCPRIRRGTLFIGTTRALVIVRAQPEGVARELMVVGGQDWFLVHFRRPLGREAWKPMMPTRRLKIAKPIAENRGTGTPVTGTGRISTLALS
jgi:hypothetical protein